MKRDTIKLLLSSKICLPHAFFQSWRVLSSIGMLILDPLVPAIAVTVVIVAARGAPVVVAARGAPPAIVVTTPRRVSVPVVVAPSAVPVTPVPVPVSVPTPPVATTRRAAAVVLVVSGPVTPPTAAPPALEPAVATQLEVDGVLALGEGLGARRLGAEDVEALLVVHHIVVVEEHEGAVLGLELAQRRALAAEHEAHAALVDVEGGDVGHLVEHLRLHLHLAVVALLQRDVDAELSHLTLLLRPDDLDPAPVRALGIDLEPGPAEVGEPLLGGPSAPQKVGHGPGLEDHLLGAHAGPVVRRAGAPPAAIPGPGPVPPHGAPGTIPPGGAPAPVPPGGAPALAPTRPTPRART
mmetsp:Transcript_54329/g.132746  ORF Transcript_54329/g.132746 Transcript_54329/m.132746 type:complete len:352 (+) Transcript_54329:4610-5665(+)